MPADVRNGNACKAVVAKGLAVAEARLVHEVVSEHGNQVFSLKLALGDRRVMDVNRTFFARVKLVRPSVLGWVIEDECGWHDKGSVTLAERGCMMSNFSGCS